MAVAVVLLGGTKELLLHLKEISGPAWIPAIVIFYIVGLAIQGAAFDINRSKSPYQYHVLADDSAFSKRLVEYEQALNMAPEKLHVRLSQQRERFVALKHATANGSVALLVADLIMLWKLWSENLRWPVVGLGLALLFIVYALWYSCYYLRLQQNEFELNFIEKSPTFGTVPSAQPGQAVGQQNK
jgi:hypothetical protein